jgi:hypothetical protein
MYWRIGVLAASLIVDMILWFYHRRQLSSIVANRSNSVSSYLHNGNGVSIATLISPLRPRASRMP